MNLRLVGFSCILATAIALVLSGCGAASSSKASGATSGKATVTVAQPVAVHKTTPASTTVPPSSAAPPPAAPTTAAPAAPVAPVAPNTNYGLSPAEVVEAYFAAINAQNYEAAWNLGGENLGGSYSQFAAGFADTKADDVEVVSTNGDSVNVNLTSTQTDGTVQQFAGSYTVTGQAITSAAINEIGGAPAESLCGAPPNPYGYNLCGVGSTISNPPSNICSYFSCIDNFWNSNGYMVECGDGSYSMAGGYSEACSYNGGVAQTVRNSN